MSWAPAFLSNPERFMAFSRWAAPLFGLIAVGLGVWGLWLGFNVPDDYQQGQTVRIMFIHVPAAWICMFIYVCLAVASFLSLIFRHALADAAAQAAAPLGAAFTFLALVTGALWGRPMWGAYWVWDARLTSVLVLFLIYLAYIALRASLDDETKASRAAAILALVGAINLPIIKYSVEWWNTLHQGASVFRADGPTLAPVFLWPLLIMGVAYLAAFGSLWLVRIRGEVWKRRAEAAAMRTARG
ncbi:MAG: cytochrome c biogenesis protein CcsA [Phenylobacterium sp.]|uniref:heme ABC transporter permease CcmC n=1 Tax=Phenylobacterium sp. TaxID=1871053 RepID=UPI001A386AC0|nr:heme ABC transporter permease CcmC [Phenylobacterium sp.]MBL8769791.1 cytochrome c biogenesis protein CcsA [Phenylobacterium sp.]